MSEPSSKAHVGEGPKDAPICPGSFRYCGILAGHRADCPDCLKRPKVVRGGFVGLHRAYPAVGEIRPVIAAVDLVGRAGAREFELGYLHDDVPAGWWATAKYGGHRITVEDQPGPVEAAEALARRILTGAKCRCGKLVALSDLGAVAYDAVRMADGSTWTAEEAAEAGQCRWTREGRRWRMGCEAKPNRAQRRRRR